MAWTIELDRAAVRDLDKFDQQTARRILAFLHERVATLEDPRSIGEALKGSKLGEFWKYLVGDSRVIARIEDNALRVLRGEGWSPRQGISLKGRKGHRNQGEKFRCSVGVRLIGPRSLSGIRSLQLRINNLQTSYGS